MSSVRINDALVLNNWFKRLLIAAINVMSYFSSLLTAFLYLLLLRQEIRGVISLTSSMFVYGITARELSFDNE